MKTLKTLLLIALPLLGGQTMSVLIHALINDSGLFLVFAWLELLVFALPISLLTCFFVIHKRYSYLNKVDLIKTYFLLQLVTIEFIILTIELLGVSIDDRLSFIAIYFYILVIPLLFLYFLKNFTLKNIHSIGFTILLVVYMLIYVVYPPSAHDICDEISIGISEVELITTVEQYIPLTENGVGKKNYFIESNTPGRKRYLISTGGVYCSISLDEEGKISSAEKSEEAI